MARHVPGAKVPRVMLLGLARALSVAGERLARLTRRPPLIPRGALHFLESHAVPVSRRAQEELGWSDTDFDEGLRRTLSHFAAQGWISQ